MTGFTEDLFDQSIDDLMRSFLVKHLSVMFIDIAITFIECAWQGMMILMWKLLLYGLRWDIPSNLPAVVSSRGGKQAKTISNATNKNSLEWQFSLSSY